MDILKCVVTEKMFLGRELQILWLNGHPRRSVIIEVDYHSDVILSST